MARKLDKTQLVNLYRRRIAEGELFTPQMSAPSDMVNYFIHVGNSIATANEKAGETYKPVIIRYAMLEPSSVDTDAEIDAAIRKHQQVFRTTLSRIRADYKRQGLQLIQFKANVHAAYKMDGQVNVMIYGWEFQLKAAVNRTIAALGDDTLIIKGSE